MKLCIDTADLNDMQRDALVRFVHIMKTGGSADLHCRKDGKDRIFQADFLKYLKELL